eukprot:804027-Prymnesium_polylepis.1
MCMCMRSSLAAPPPLAAAAPGGGGCDTHPHRPRPASPESRAPLTVRVADTSTAPRAAGCAAAA